MWQTSTIINRCNIKKNNDCVNVRQMLHLVVYLGFLVFSLWSSFSPQSPQWHSSVKHPIRKHVHGLTAGELHCQHEREPLESAHQWLQVFSDYCFDINTAMLSNFWYVTYKIYLLLVFIVLPEIIFQQ